jgi:hypothetical protein
MKQTLEGINRLYVTEEKISEFEDLAIEIILNETHREKSD